MVGVLRVYGSRPVMAAANLFVTLFRGFPRRPALHLVFRPPYIKIYLTPSPPRFWASPLQRGLSLGVYPRGASVDQAGADARRPVAGLQQGPDDFSIILPQAIRRALPGCGNEIIYLINTRRWRT